MGKNIIKESEMLKTLRPLQKTEALYRAIDLAENHIVNYIGVPICMEHCGKCCEVTTPDVWEVEARFLISAITGSGGTTLDALTSACEDWLIERNPYLKTYGMPAKELSVEEWEKLRPEMNHLLENSPCPFLTGEKRCLIHFARPLACRCYGVTRIATQICPRPLSRKYETEDIRANIAPDSPLGIRLREMLLQTLKDAEVAGWGWTYFMPTILYMILQPEKFRGYVSDARIPTAKLLRLRTNTSILFQDQLNEIWAREKTLVH